MELRGVSSGHRGFTMVEVMIAIVLLAIGVLGLASTSGYVTRAVSLADLRSERAAALQSGIETVRAMHYDSIDSGSDSIGLYDVSWTSVANGRDAKTVTLITIGPGMLPGSGTGGGPVVHTMVADTFEYVVLGR